VEVPLTKHGTSAGEGILPVDTVRDINNENFWACSELSLNYYLNLSTGRFLDVQR
jgi:hypothetical protein